MDVFKLAFETTIVGLFAFLWIGIAIDLLAPSLLPRLLAAVNEKNQTLAGVATLSLAYCLGSAILPIAGQLVNDEHWPLPENAIRCWVSLEQDKELNQTQYAILPKPYVPLGGDLSACRCTFWDRFLPVDVEKGRRTVELSKLSGPTALDVARKQQILTIFQLRETQVMNQGSDRTEQIRQLHERIVVLRGAVLHGFVPLLIGLFGCIAPVHGEPCSRKRKRRGAVLAAVFTIFALFNGVADLIHPFIYDIPVLEALLGCITLFGGFLVFNGIKKRSILSWQFMLVVSFFFVLAYGGWMWSEIIYDQQVIDASAVMDSAGETAKPAGTK